MTLMEKNPQDFSLYISKPKFHCTVHKNNQLCISIATAHKFTLSTKHIAIKFHHFRSNIKQGRIKILYCCTTNQNTALLTKPLGEDVFSASVNWYVVGTFPFSFIGFIAMRECNNIWGGLWASSPVLGV